MGVDDQVRGPVPITSVVLRFRPPCPSGVPLVLSSMLWPVASRMSPALTSLRTSTVRSLGT